MTRTRKILAIGAGTLVVLIVAALIVIPLVLEDRVAAFVRTEANDRLNATVDFVEIDLTLLSTFPTLTAEVLGLRIVGQGEFEGETLLEVRAFSLGLDLLALVFDDQVRVESVKIDTPDVRVRVTEEGLANYDIVKDAGEPDEGGAVSFQIRALRIIDGSLLYDTPDIHVAIDSIEHRGSADVGPSTQSLKAETTAAEVTAQVGRVTYLKKADVRIDLDATFEPAASKLELGALEVAVNALSVAGSGTIGWPDDSLVLDLAVESGKGESIKGLVSAIPSAYARDLKGVEAGGRFSLSARVQGELGPDDNDLPSFSASLAVRDGSLQYPDLPLPLSDISIDAKANHPGGSLDKMQAEVSKFNVSAGRSHASGSVRVVKPISRPDVTLALDGRFDMADVANAYPMPDVETLDGVVTTTLNLVTHAETIERLEGELRATKVTYDTKDAPPVHVDQAHFAFTPKSTRIHSLRAEFGRTDVALSGTLSPVTTFIEEESAITGNLRLESSAIYVDDFLSEDGETDSGETTPFLLPDGIDAQLAIDVRKLAYGDLTLSDFVGTARLRNRTLTLKNMKAKALGGSMKVSGAVATPVGKPATFDLDYSVDRASFAQAFEALPSMRTYAPIAKFLDGRFSADLHASGQLGEDGSPKLRSIDANGLVMTLQSKLGADFKPLSVLSSAVPAIPKQLDLSSVRTKFSIEDGAVKVKPFAVKSRGMTLDVSGSHGLDQEMAYVVGTEIPAAKVTGNLSEKVAGLGVDLSKVKNVGLSAKLTGSITKPRVAVDVDTGALRSAAAATVAEELEEQRQRALAAVALQSARITAEAEKQANQIRKQGKKAAALARKEGNKRADQLIAEAGTNTLAQIGAKEGAKQIRRETDKRADQLEREANKRADQLVREAQKRADQLRAEAEAQSARGIDETTKKIAE